MTHWGWYWKIKQQHKPKQNCESYKYLDSFNLFKQDLNINTCDTEDVILTYKEQQLIIEITEGPLKKETYAIKVNKQPCNFGGFRFYFYCPICTKRMQKLYGLCGLYLCRKCLNLGYESQRMAPSLRYLHRANVIKAKLKNLNGSIYTKPKWMRKKTYLYLRQTYWDYIDLYDKAMTLEFYQLFGNKIGSVH